MCGHLGIDQSHGLDSDGDTPMLEACTAETIDMNADIDMYDVDDIPSDRGGNLAIEDILRGKSGSSQRYITTTPTSRTSAIIETKDTGPLPERTEGKNVHEVYSCWAALP
ncbi:hypothetical protein JX265_012060 [Neoarthrinium moseri]|uniref:Uncharacterized protein n=1 Tax=Neoarthrinium moseri TaxID=1658444 RepID=A0A9Q0AH51_9PEZI|nr:hypothetical protein JX265_012060 [Neoarthrinium moseri]